MQRFLYSLLLVQCTATFAQSPRITTPENADLDESRYYSILRSEREGTSTQVIYEDIAAGAAALTIGLYGYYNDRRGSIVKIAYTATQTAGIYMISDAILRSTRPSLLLLSDRHLRNGGVLAYDNYKKGVVAIMRRIKNAETKRTAYTTGILSLTNGYAAYRERKQKALKNVFTFLSANFFFISTISFYQLYINDYDDPAAPNDSQPRLQGSLLPYPSVTYNF